MDRYRVNGTFISFDQFANKIVEMLRTFKYADLEQLSIVLKARKDDIDKVLKDFIVKYVKANPNITIRQVCTRLCVKVDFIQELIEEGRIEFKDVPEEEKSIDAIIKEQASIADLNNQAIEQIKRRDAIGGLNVAASTIKQTPKEPEKKSSIGLFHVYKKDK